MNKNARTGQRTVAFVLGSSLRGETPRQIEGQWVTLRRQDDVADRTPLLEKKPSNAWANSWKVGGALALLTAAIWGYETYKHRAQIDYHALVPRTMVLTLLTSIGFGALTFGTTESKDKKKE